ncbi:NAD-dependent epimerase/dehydratase family protein [Nonomuraea insulae]|uniref:NAD-dependent epimerase/dehydratase family protein n=1 Tax=Nonomuraea insulae TaxID=1616787 RepID=A0ABW1D7M4_9ACTN
MADRVLVTGGAGFIGAHLARRLLRDGARVTLLDDFSRGVMDEDLRELAHGSDLVRHDLTQPIPPGLLTDDFDTVYHLAAVVGVARAMSDPSKVLRTNLLTTIHLLDYCDRIRPQALFLSSTSEIGDGSARPGLPTREDTPFTIARPHSPRASYALSKAAAEAMVYARTSRFRVRIGRYYNIYGPRMGSAHVIPQFIARIHADPFPIYGAYQRRAFCFVEDAVEATLALTNLPGAEPIVMNIGNDREEIMIIDLARRLMALAGVQRRISVLDPPAGSPERRLPDLAVLRALLPERTPTSLDTGLPATLRWYRDRGKLPWRV